MLVFTKKLGIIHLMDILFMILGFFIGFYLLNGKTKGNSSTCYPHKWVYKKQDEHEYMVCSVCKKLPGTDDKEEGNT